MNMPSLLVAVSALLFIGCGGSSSNDDHDDNNEAPTWEALDNTFSDIESYDKSHFTLSTQVDYWSVVVNESVISEEPSLVVKYGFDDADYDALDETQKNEIDTAFSNSGFTRGGCLPEHCPYYAVTLGSGGNVTILDSDMSLAEFFAPIDTEAELHVYLWAGDYEPTSFQSADGGYQAIVVQETCDFVTTSLLFIDHNGVITVEEELDQESKDPPECA